MFQRLTQPQVRRTQALLCEGPTDSVVQTEVGYMKDSFRTTVRLPSQTRHRIESLARARGLTGASIVRSAIEDFLSRAETGLDVTSATLGRIALTTEFTQAAVDILLGNVPDSDKVRDQVIHTVETRMERYHGQK